MFMFNLGNVYWLSYAFIYIVLFRFIRPWLCEDVRIWGSFIELRLLKEFYPRIFLTVKNSRFSTYFNFYFFIGLGVPILDFSRAISSEVIYWMEECFFISGKTISDFLIISDFAIIKDFVKVYTVVSGYSKFLFFGIFFIFSKFSIFCRKLLFIFLFDAETLSSEFDFSIFKLYKNF
jgi:hypothetical protein